MCLPFSLDPRVPVNNQLSKSTTAVARSDQLGLQNIIRATLTVARAVTILETFLIYTSDP